MDRVKGKGKRAEKARATRLRMLEAARDLFVEHGYGATALQDIADRAGVAVQTIYFTFGNKRSLLKELVDVTVAGDDEPVSTMERDWYRAALAAETAAAQLRAQVAGSRQVLDRVAPINEMLRTAASTDPEVLQLWPQDTDPRYTVLSAAAEAMTAKPGANPGVPAVKAADILYAVLSPELYLLFVRDRGWTPQRWEQWAYTTLHAQLCS